MTGKFDELFQEPKGTWTQRFDEGRPSAPEGEQTAGNGPYKPYGYTPVHDIESCDIAWWMPGDIPQGQEIQYRFLIRVAYIGDDHLQLMMSDCIIALDGKNLRDLRKRLARGRVTFIQAFNPRIWPKPPDGEALIDRITVMYPGETAFPTN